jgi:hypothetical protein
MTPPLTGLRYCFARSRRYAAAQLTKCNFSTSSYCLFTTHNFHVQCLNIYKTAVVQKRRVETSELVGHKGSNVLFPEPRVHAFVYEPSTGQATKLPVDFKRYLDDLRPLYDLYTPAEPEVVHPITLIDG